MPIYNSRRKFFIKDKHYILNFYTSYDLAISCLNCKTHIVGTLKNNKKFISKTILHHKIRREEMISKEDDNEIVSNGEIRGM